MFENVTGESYDKNRLMLSYNPMMSIALSADLLTKIGDGRRRFKDQCMNLKADILELGKVFNSKHDEVGVWINGVMELNMDLIQQLRIIEIQLIFVNLLYKTQKFNLKKLK